MQEEKKINLSKNDVELLYNILHGKKVTILGHDNPDVDSVLSAILFSKLLDFWKIENEFLILQEIKEDDTYSIVKELFGIDMSKYQMLGEDSNRNIVLLDHYQTLHQGKVLACIDHHFTTRDFEYPFKYVKHSCATAYLIYEIMQEAGYVPLKEDVEMIVMAMLIDTVAFKSTKTVEREANVAKELAKKYDVDFYLLEKYGLALTDISSMSDENIISNGEKWYNYRRRKDVGSSYLQLYGMPSQEVINKWLELILAKRINTGADMLIFLIFDVKEGNTYEYRITTENIEKLSYQGILSRGKDIMPKIEAMFVNS